MNQKLLDLIAPNSFVIVADADGAEMYAKLRGVTAEEMGKMLGLAYATLDRKLDALREHVASKNGEPGLRKFNEGFGSGRHGPMDEESMRLIERRPDRDSGGAK